MIRIIKTRAVILGRETLTYINCKNSFSTAARIMTSIAVKDPGQLFPPREVKGMLKLEKEKFSKTIVVPWLEIDERHVGGGMHILKKYLLKLVSLKPLQPGYELLPGEEILSDNIHESVVKGSIKRVLLNPVLIGSVEDFEEQEREKLEKQGISSELKFSKILINYNNWRIDEILKAILPDEGLTSYSIIGHIVHVNLRDYLLPFKEIIGEVLLDKVHGAKTVVNKTDVIDNTYRNFKMEILCGEQNMKTRTKENGCMFELDFSAVYWNPRLSTEHERLAAKLKKGDVLYDVFSGIGPFAIPAAKKKCYVLANDLNPESYKWLNVNCKLNKVQEFVRTFNKDGREFIEDDVKKDLLQRVKSSKFGEGSMHITMNLPALAVSFLPAFCGLLQGCLKSVVFKSYPVVHVYCFVSGENPEILAQKTVEENLGCELGKNLIEVCFVRNVSPNKDMLRVSFKLSREILSKKPDIHPVHVADEQHEEPCAKKICLSDDVR